MDVLRLKQCRRFPYPSSPSHPSFLQTRAFWDCPVSQCVSGLDPSAPMACREHDRFACFSRCMDFNCTGKESFRERRDRPEGWCTRYNVHPVLRPHEHRTTTCRIVHLPSPSALGSHSMHITKGPCRHASRPSDFPLLGICHGRDIGW